jgi:hypothetical protein
MFLRKGLADVCSEKNSSKVEAKMWDWGRPLWSRLEKVVSQVNEKATE